MEPLTLVLSLSSVLSALAVGLSAVKLIWKSSVEALVIKRLQQSLRTHLEDSRQREYSEFQEGFDPKHDYSAEEHRNKIAALLEVLRNMDDDQRRALSDALEQTSERGRELYLEKLIDKAVDKRAEAQVGPL